MNTRSIASGGFIRMSVLVGIFAIVFVGLLSALSPATATHVSPVFMQGNPDCNDLTLPFLVVESLKVEPVDSGEFDDGTLFVDIDVDSSDDGEVFDWTANLGVGAVIVKGGPNANVYFYDPGAVSDTELHAPVNPSGNFADLSHIEFCYDPAPPTPTPTPTATPTATPTPTDCPERQFGLYCPEDPSPEEDPNNPTPTPTPTATPDGQGGNGGPTPTPTPTATATPTPTATPSGQGGSGGSDSSDPDPDCCPGPDDPQPISSAKPRVAAATVAATSPAGVGGGLTSFPSSGPDTPWILKLILSLFF